jgi:hypothetical protein
MNSAAVLIITGSALVSLILVFYFRRAVRLLLISMVYGKYSYKYIKIYKDYFIRSPFKYCFRDDFIAHILFVLIKKPEVPSYKSLKDIYFEKTAYFTEYKQFLKKKGQPFCFNAFLLKEKGCEIKALGYNETVNGSKAISVYYFMNDLFFMGEYIFKNPKTDIKSSLIDHFLDSGAISSDNFYIENSKDRVIHFLDTGFTIDIKYLSREDHEIIGTLQDYYTQLTSSRAG